MELLRNISESLIAGNKIDVANKVNEACKSNLSALQILNEGLLSGLEIVGKRFKNNEMYIPEVLASAAAMHAGLEILKPLLTGEGSQPLGKVVIATVAGDVHDIGKNIVAMMLEAARFRVVDLGVDVSIDRVVEAVKREKPEIIALSGLLSTTITMFKPTLQAVKEAGLTPKSIVGGAQVTAAYAKEAGADAYAPNAVVAVDVVKNLVGIKN
jgi:5-methyltetrahydrofolate--homocysteine methyltransferase